jgi:diaminopimelate decarboxylase
LQIINDLAKAKGKIASVAIRINPNVDAHTHHFITTGLEENKFGINTWELPAVAEALKNCPELKFLGIHFHIGSQITDMEVYKNLCIRVNELQLWFEERGLPITVLNLGGGLGVDYYNPDEKPICDFESYFKVFSDNLNVKAGQEVHFELGRALVAQCASLVSRVLYVKNGIKKNFLILDAGMTELIRPMLYQAYHVIENLTQELKFGEGDSPVTAHYSPINYDVVGPICESTDCFRKDVALPESYRGDLIVIRTAGAYGEVMASGYNLRERVQSVYSE